jgi:multidrug efflux pump
MIGETTLAMLYVPLFFYLFDRLSERSHNKKESPPSETASGGDEPKSTQHTPKEGS